MGTFVTTGDIARKLGCPLHRVCYAVQRLGIAEDARAGTYRLYRCERLGAILRQIMSLKASERPDHNEAKGQCDGLENASIEPSRDRGDVTRRTGE